MKSLNLKELTTSELLTIEGGRRIGPLFWFSLAEDGFNAGRWAVRKLLE